MGTIKMQNMQPTLEEWKALYEAAEEFRKIEPWKWMNDFDLFGVKNLQTGETGYCCIMGALGEVFAMAVYLGTEGLESYWQISNTELSQSASDAFYTQDCLLIDFVDKRKIEKPDKQIIDALGLKFKGHNTCPLFRSLKPGYVPWLLNRDEVLYMTAALQQAKNVSLRAEEDKDLFSVPDSFDFEDDIYLVRVPEMNDGTIVWKDEWGEPTPLKKDESQDVPIDELRVQCIEKNAKRTQDIWEADFFFAPTPITEGERPYFPYAIMFVDNKVGVILDIYLSGNGTHRKEFAERFLSSMEKLSTLPKAVLVIKEEAAEILEPVTSQLKIKLNIVNQLPHMEEATEAVIASLKGSDKPRRN